MDNFIIAVIGITLIFVPAIIESLQESGKKTSKLKLPKKQNWPSFDCYEYHSSLPFVRWVYFKRLRMVLDFVPPKNKNILDVGFGDGVMLKSLVSKSKKVYGIDIHGANKMVYNMCEKEGIIDSVHLDNAGVESIPFRDNFFDTTVCISVLEHVKEIEKAIKELSRTLKQGGLLVVGLPVEGFWTRLSWKLFLPQYNQDHHELTYVQVKSVLEEYFEFVGLKKLWPFYEVSCYKKIKQLQEKKCLWFF